MTVRFASFNVENLFATDLLASRRDRRRGCAEIGRPSRRGGESCG
jgi:hypothetical protein